MTRNEFVQRIVVDARNERGRTSEGIKDVIDTACMIADEVAKVVPFDAENITLLDELRAEVARLHTCIAKHNDGFVCIAGALKEHTESLNMLDARTRPPGHRG